MFVFYPVALVYPFALFIIGDLNRNHVHHELLIMNSQKRSSQFKQLFGKQQDSYLDDGLWNFWNYFDLNLIPRY